MSKIKQLGRGLSALLGDDEPGEDAGPAGRSARILPVGLLEPGRFQPRRRFDPAAMDSLVASIREQGVLQPLLVRRLPGSAERYEIVAGERRWRAAQIAQLHDVPVVLRDFDDRTALEIALVENVQREDLTALEEAEGYRRLIDEFNHTQEALAQAVGKSRSHIANLLRLLSLPDSVRNLLEDGQLSAGHARALVTMADPQALAARIVAEGLSVRAVEKLAAGAKAKAKNRPEPAPSRAVVDEAAADGAALARDLSQALGLNVDLQIEGAGGRLVLHYRSLEQLDELVLRLNQIPRPGR